MWYISIKYKCKSYRNGVCIYILHIFTVRTQNSIPKARPYGDFTFTYNFNLAFTLFRIQLECGSRGMIAGHSDPRTYLG